MAKIINNKNEGIMKTSSLFNLLTDIFDKSFSNLLIDRVTNEKEWEYQLYYYFREALGEEYLSKYVLRLECPTRKYGNNILWIPKNKFDKKFSLIEEFFDVELDEEGHAKIDYSKNKKHLTNDISTLLEAEKKRAYYTDVLLSDLANNRPLLFIELKFKNNLNERLVRSDYIKLLRQHATRSHPFIAVAAGFDPLNSKIYWEPTDPKYNFNFNLKVGKKKRVSSKLLTSETEEKLISDITKKQTKFIYENYIYTSEATWTAEIIWAFKQAFPSSYSFSAEFNSSSYSGRIDIGILKNSILQYGIELKGHFEPGIPPELRNGTSFSNSITQEFLEKTALFLERCRGNKSLESKLSEFPKTSENKPYVTSDLFSKIIELYNQTKRLTAITKSGEIMKGYVVFIDHMDDYRKIKRKYNISEEEFIANFKFRKHIISKILEPVIGKNEFIYFYALNQTNNKKKMFLLDD